MAEAFYLTGDIERYGTGFVRIRYFLQDYPELTLFVEEMGDFFKVELKVTEQVTEQVTEEIVTLLQICNGELSRNELQERLHLKHRVHFTTNYLKPAMGRND